MNIIWISSGVSECKWTGNLLSRCRVSDQCGAGQLAVWGSALSPRVCLSPASRVSISAEPAAIQSLLWRRELMAGTQQHKQYQQPCTCYWISPASELIPVRGLHWTQVVSVRVDNMAPVSGSPLEQVEAFIKDNKVMVFSKSTCPFCFRIKQLFDSLGIQYTAIELDQIGKLTV